MQAIAPSEKGIAMLGSLEPEVDIVRLEMRTVAMSLETEVGDTEMADIEKRENIEKQGDIEIVLNSEMDTERMEGIVMAEESGMVGFGTQGTMAHTAKVELDLK